MYGGTTSSGGLMCLVVRLFCREQQGPSSCSSTPRPVLLSLEKDPAMFIPQLSPYYSEGVEIDDSADIDDLDPVWRNIKQYYKGYNKSYFIPFTSAHVKNLSAKTEISDDIMKLAEDLKIIPFLDGSSISIRFATAKDNQWN